MSDVNEAGFDRRSLIKKGLVTGGVIATVPIISTFNAPAAAFSPPGFRIHINIAIDLNVLGLIINLGGPVRVPTPDPSNTGCAGFEPDWDEAQPDPGTGDIPISASGSVNLLSGGFITFTLGATTPPGMMFAGGVRAGTCAAGVIGGGGQSITFGLGLLAIVLSDNFFLIVN